MVIIRVVAPAKVNLFLHITGRRADGYHLLDSLVVFTEYGDRLELSPAQSLTLAVSGQFASSLQQSGDNIVLKAARLLKEQTGCEAGAHIALEKNIPVGAGLGGGSSDAAAALTGLIKLWNLQIDETALQAIALQLGSDVPVCLRRQSAWMQGIGERITPVALQSAAWLVLVNPGDSLLTADVFRQFSGAFAPPEKPVESIGSFEALLQIIQPARNMLEAAAMVLAPVIKEVLKVIETTPECQFSRVSGSGATCFGFYDNETAAVRAADEIKRRYPAWWCVAARLK